GGDGILPGREVVRTVQRGRQTAGKSALEIADKPAIVEAGDRLSLAVEAGFRISQGRRAGECTGERRQLNLSGKLPIAKAIGARRGLGGSGIGGCVDRRLLRCLASGGVRDANVEVAEGAIEFAEEFILEYVDFVQVQSIRGPLPCGVIADVADFECGVAIELPLDAELR